MQDGGAEEQEEPRSLMTQSSHPWSHPPAHSFMCGLGRCSFIILLLATELIPPDMPWSPQEHVCCSQRLEQVTP